MKDSSCTPDNGRPRILEMESEQNSFAPKISPEAPHNLDRMKWRFSLRSAFLGITILSILCYPAARSYHQAQLAAMRRHTRQQFREAGISLQNFNDALRAFTVSRDELR